MKRGRLKKAALSVIAGCAALALVAGCSAQTADEGEQPADAPAAETRTIIDMSGAEVEIPATVEKYAESWYAHNEVDIMLDGAEGMVATCASKEAYPWMYQVAPTMNDALFSFGSDFNIEEIVALEPDVVFGSSEELRAQFEAVGIPYVNAMFRTYDEMKQSVEMTGEVLGQQEKAAEYNDYLDGILGTLDSQLGGLSDDEKPSVLHGQNVYGLTIDGVDTIIDAWITAAGGVNAAQGVSDNNQTVTLEQIIMWDPDYIITDTASDVESIMNDPAWSVLTAVQNGNVYVNPKGVFLWDRYGVEEALQLQWAANLMHPDIVDIDFYTVVKDFYEQFLNYDLTDAEVDLILAAEAPQD